MEHLIIFGGKGGVGKSSISTATAIYIAQQLRDKKILLVSFDIAHNLSDLFDREIGNDVTQITPNLFVIEPDPDLYTERYTHELTQKIRELFRSSRMISLIPDLESIIEDSVKGENLPLAMKNGLFFQSILDAENPMAGIGESQLKFVGLNQRKYTPIEERETIPPFDIIVCDFPPTGNMLALFEVPADPSRRLMKFALNIVSAIQNSFNKLKKLTTWAKPATWMAGKIIKDDRPDDSRLEKDEQENLAQEILDILFNMEKRSDRIAALMRGIGSLRLVTIAEKPSFEETKRARDLSAPFIAVDAIHTNRLIPLEERGKTKYLDNILATQERYVAEIRKNFADLKIWESSLLDTPPIGNEGLLVLAREVYKDTPLWDILNPMHRTLKNPEADRRANPLNIDEMREKWNNA